jgi:hypothetical protein
MDTALRVSSRAFAALLILYPDELRREFGDEMTDVFGLQLEEAWEESGFAGLIRVWIRAIGELLFVALPAQLAQPIVVVPMLSLISNSFMFLALLKALSPLAELCRANRMHP